VQAVTKGLASIVPVLGGPAVEILEYLFKPTLDARKDEWLGDLASEFLAMKPISRRRNRP
jgi:hypothetical protein